MNKKLFFTILTLTFLISSCSIFGIRNLEGPEYESKVIDGNYEHRKYSSYIVAETYIYGEDDDDETFDTVTSIGFRRLADYIFGENYRRDVMFRGSQEIDMTSPVIVDHSIPTTINMTKPFGARRRGQAIVDLPPIPQDKNLLIDGNNNIRETKKWRVAFVMPSLWTMESIPVPKQMGVHIKEIEGYEVVTKRFSNTIDMEDIKKYEEELRLWAKNQGIKLKPGLRTAIYDPMWTVPFLRRNEIQIFVDTETAHTCCSMK